MNQVSKLTEKLRVALTRADNQGGIKGELKHLKRLSGGANMETWSFDWMINGQLMPLILRRVPGTIEDVGIGDVDIETEARLIQAAYESGVPVPRVILILRPDDQLGRGFIMSREEGEALPNRILTDSKYEKARQNLAYQCGQILAKIHSTPLDKLPDEMVVHDADFKQQSMRRNLDELPEVPPAFETAYKWLIENRPKSDKQVLVHGDFRNGNLLINELGVTSVLDWELSHIGDPVQDLGYLSCHVWRFNSPLPVGGFGTYDQLFSGYASVAGWRPDMESIHYWQVYSALAWGIVSSAMLEMFRSGKDVTLERAAIGRRVTESELDILLLLEDRLLPDIETVK